MLFRSFAFCCSLALILSCSSGNFSGAQFYITATVEPQSLPGPNSPCEVEIDFADQLKRMGENGAFDPSSVSVEGKNPQTGQFEPVDYRLSEHFKTQTKGKVWWLVKDPQMTEYRISFDTRPGTPRDYIPAIGVGDELMFNTEDQVVLPLANLNQLIDYDGDGISDILVQGHHSERFGWPYDGIFFYKGVSEDVNGINFRYHSRIHYIPLGAASDSLVPISIRYNWVKPVDWDRDGLLDLLLCAMSIKKHPWFSFLKNTGKKRNGLPLLREVKRYPANAILDGDSYVPAVGAEDLDNDGKIDLLGGRTLDPEAFGHGFAMVYFYRNLGTDGQGNPKIADPVLLGTETGDSVIFRTYAGSISLGDVDGDGKTDIIGSDMYNKPTHTAWYKNRGGSPPVFEEKQEFEELSGQWVHWQNREGLVGEGPLGENTFFQRTIKDGKLYFEPAGNLKIRKIDGPLVGGTQEKPDWVDWDEDGDMDLLSGNDKGYLHWYENVGTWEYPKFKAPEWIEADGQRIRIYRDGVLGGKHWHGMAGYVSVACVDWDQDGLFDLLVPNETNRVFWFRNIGDHGSPKFSQPQQILPDGFSDSDELREQTRLKTLKEIYPRETSIPFDWRTRLALADYTGDGLVDIIGRNGNRDLVLYERYRTGDGSLRLKNGQQLTFDDGTPITEDGNKYRKVRNCDWDGDGLIDLIMTQNLFKGNKYSLFFLKNVGTKTKPVFKRPEAIKRWGKPISYSNHGFQPSLVDWDRDGSLDFVGCSESGYYIFFRHSVLTASQPPCITLSMPGRL